MIIGKNKKQEKKINSKKREYKIFLSQREVDALFKAGDLPIKLDDHDVFSSREEMYRNSVEIYSYLVRYDEEMFRKTLNKLDSNSLIRTYRLVRHVVLDEEMDKEVDSECELTSDIIDNLKKMNKEKDKPKQFVKEY